MTEEQDPPPRIRRFKWARSVNPWGREIEGIAAVWIEGGLSCGEVREELAVLKRAASVEIYMRTDLGRRFQDYCTHYGAIFDDIFCFEKALEKSEKREDVTPEERLRTLQGAIKRLQQGGMQR